MSISANESLYRDAFAGRRVLILGGLGFIGSNLALRLALDGQTIPIFGDGRIKRDFLYIDDCVDALFALAVTPEAKGEVFNIGHDAPSDFLTLAQRIIDKAGAGDIAFTPFSPERKAQELGDFYSNIGKITRITGWRPTTPLDDGVAASLEFYRANREQYW